MKHKETLRVGILDYSPIYGGAERMLDALVEGLPQTGVDVTVFCPFPMEHQKRYRFRHDRLQYLARGKKWWMGTWRWGSKAVRGSDAFSRLMFGMRLASNLYKRRIRVLHVNLLRVDCFFWLLPSWLCGVRIVGHFRSFSSDWVTPRRVVALCRSIVCVSDCNRSLLTGRHKLSKIVRVHDAVVNLGKCKDKLELPPTVWSVGQVWPQKGHDIAIEAFQMIADDYPELHLAVAGSGSAEELARLREMAAGQPRIHIDGRQRDDMASVYTSARLVLSLSRGGEAFGLVPFESMSFGTPFIGIAEGAIMEICGQHASGFLVQKPEAKEVSEKMRMFLDDTEKARKEVKKLYEKVRPLLQPERMCRQMKAVFEAASSGMPVEKMINEEYNE